MDCKKIKIWLSDYLHDELDDSKRAAIEKHLEKCSDCRQALEDLKYYRSVLQQVDPIKSPDDLREKIMDEVTGKIREIRTPFLQTAFYRVGRYAAAAVLILAIVLVPLIHQPARIEISYAQKVVKKGKGGIEEKRETEEVTLIREMAELSNGSLILVKRNGKTGLVDFIEVKIPKEEYSFFAERYNGENVFEQLPFETPGGLRKNIRIKIYYPGRRFITGDFNGDGRDDILAHYFRGAQQGEWFLSYNCTDSFGVPGQITVEPGILHVPVPDQLISGDFNGDGFDDLAVGKYINTTTSEWSLVLNDKTGSFSDRYDLRLEGDSLLATGPFHAYAADINGDGSDELVVHFLEGDLFDQWWCFVNMGNLTFYKPIKLPVVNMSDTLAGASRVFFMDNNGDGRDDMLIYWKRKHDPEWWLSVNQKNMTMGPPFVITRAYQGSYSPMIVDFDGDGYDEMIVKEGAEDMFGNWHLWLNLKGEEFKGDGSVNFGGKSNFVIE